MADGHQFYSVKSDKSCEGDLDEVQVWNWMMEKKDHIPKERKTKDSSFSALLPTALKSKVSQRSAPMNIPERSKICRSGSVGESSFHGDGSLGVHHYYDGFQEEEEYEEDGDGMIPPHEWIEKRVARRQVSSFSMCEGIGRTLKGRDLSKVRNAVLARTGFLE